MPRYRLEIDIDASACEWCGGEVILEDCHSEVCDCSEYVCRECGNPAQDTAGIMIDQLIEIMRSDILSAFEIVEVCDRVH
jgi:hypothetical protein